MKSVELENKLKKEVTVIQKGNPERKVLRGGKEKQPKQGGV